jgi:hypothetical protein
MKVFNINKLKDLKSKEKSFLELYLNEDKFSNPDLVNLIIYGVYECKSTNS